MNESTPRNLPVLAFKKPRYEVCPASNHPPLSLFQKRKGEREILGVTPSAPTKGAFAPLNSPGQRTERYAYFGKQVLVSIEERFAVV